MSWGVSIRTEEKSRQIEIGGIETDISPAGKIRLIENQKHEKLK